MKFGRWEWQSRFTRSVTEALRSVLRLRVSASYLLYHADLCVSRSLKLHQITLQMALTDRCEKYCILLTHFVPLLPNSLRIYFHRKTWLAFLSVCHQGTQWKGSLIRGSSLLSIEKRWCSVCRRLYWQPQTINRSYEQNARLASEHLCDIKLMWTVLQWVPTCNRWK